MRILLSSIVILNAALAMAQGPSFTNRQQTSGLVGIVAGQTARLNALYPTAPAPILQPLCAVTLTIVDDQGKVLKSTSTPQLVAGRNASLELNADTDLPGSSRTEIYALAIGTQGCSLVTNLEIIDNATQKTLLVVGVPLTYPITLSTPAMSSR
ncbi:MAG TPA: hypothetical protein VK789_22185 [Bryobacteraceae bacterium]|nr:hypothetical protein [Bryobacteraceae bacterium]